MDHQDRDLLLRLAAGPRFLFLGQSPLDNNGPGDEDSTSSETGPKRDLPPLDSLPPNAQSEDPWRQYDEQDLNRERNLAVYEVAKFPWNGIFTSRIDSALRGVFESDWRRAVPTTRAQVGRYSRSTTEMLIRMLFGGLAMQSDEQPPRTLFEAAEAESRAAEVMSTLASSIITPKGVIVFDGWSVTDWFGPKQLFTFAARLSNNQAHLFSATEEVVQNPFVQAAREQGVLVTHIGSLCDFLNESEAAGKLSSGATLGDDRNARLIPLKDSFVELDIDRWNQVTRSARPVDVSLLEPFARASAETNYQRFRTFLGAGEGIPPWKAVASGYKLVRDFEADLRKRVEEAMHDPLASKPVIVAGQTATGKSMALCSLALDFARSGEAAVLHQSRRRDRPSLGDIDSFATWAEESGASCTILCWDGMVDPDEYYSLHRQLRSRGRRVVIVGTSYSPEFSSPNVVEAKAAMTLVETRKIQPWLRKFGIEFPQHALTTDSSFLALLFRALPETEQGLRRGLSLEVRSVESRLEALAKDESRNFDTRMSAVAQALTDAGFDLDSLTPSQRPDEELVDLAFTERSAAERLTALVLVAGRRGVPVPLELAMRILGRDGSTKIVELVQRFDIFRWSEDDNGDQFLGSRTKLEAELLAREDLTIDGEVEVIVQFIQNLNPTTSGFGGSDVQFIADLFERIGPQSEEAIRYWRFYRSMAEAFSQLRESGGAAHPRLVLLEANLMREYVQKSQDKEVVNAGERLEILQAVRQILEEAIEESDASRRTRLNLLVELASTVGAQIYEVGKYASPSPEELEKLMAVVVSAASRARAIDPENIYPVDVVVWSTQRAVETGVLDDRLTIDLLANAVASLESLDSEVLSPKQKAAYDRRGVEIARLRDNSEVEAHHLTALMENEDPAAYYFIAKEAADSGSKGLQSAVQILREAPSEVRNDWRCAGLLLDLFWRDKTGQKLMKGERQLVAFTIDDWEDCLNLTDAIPNVSGYDRIRADFVKGLAHFHLGSYSRSKSVFSALDRESIDLGARIIAKYLASNLDGTAQLFTGSVTWANADGRRGGVWVDQLRTEVSFIPLRFSVSSLRQKGESMPRFHIAFNMRGPLAEPVRNFPDRGSRGTS